jgi:hypothetical protein
MIDTQTILLVFKLIWVRQLGTYLTLLLYANILGQTAWSQPSFYNMAASAVILNVTIFELVPFYNMATSTIFKFWNV